MSVFTSVLKAMKPEGLAAQKEQAVVTKRTAKVVACALSQITWVPEIKTRTPSPILSALKVTIFNPHLLCQMETENPAKHVTAKMTAWDVPGDAATVETDHDRELGGRQGLLAP